MKFFLNIILFSIMFCNHVPVALFNFNDKTCYDVDFYSEVGKRDWDSYDLVKKQRVFDDFLKKELSFLDGLKQGLHLHPDVVKKLQQREKQLLINNAYEHFIARPLISNNEVALNVEKLKTTANIWHILIGFKESLKSTGANINQEQAVKLIKTLKNSISDSLSAGKDLRKTFSMVAFQFSDDPSSKTNKGNLGWVDWGNTVSSFQNPVFNLNKNSLSDPILTDYGYHLVFVESFANSNYFYYPVNIYNDLAYKVGMRTLDFDSLKEKSSSFDSLLLKESNFSINKVFAVDVFNFILEKKQKERLVSNKYSLIEWLQSYEKTGVLATYNERAFGLNWLLNIISNIPSTRIPRFAAFEDFENFLSSLVLEKLVLDLAINKKINNTTSFQRDYLDSFKNIVFNEYISSLINNIEIDSLDIVDQYNKGVFVGKHINPKRVVVSEIKFKSLVLANEAKKEIDTGLSFDEALNIYNGKVREPIAIGTGGAVGEFAFSMKKGEVSNVISNPNGSFSIFKIERFLNEEPFSLSVVYQQIERKLLKERQDLIKNSFLNSFISKNQIKVNYEAIGL